MISRARWASTTRDAFAAKWLAFATVIENLQHASADRQSNFQTCSWGPAPVNRRLSGLVA